MNIGAARAYEKQIPYIPHDAPDLSPVIEILNRIMLAEGTPAYPFVCARRAAQPANSTKDVSSRAKDLTILKIVLLYHARHEFKRIQPRYCPN